MEDLNYDIIGKGEKELIYKGAFEYLVGDRIYSEETFQVYRHNKDLSLNFISELHGRVASGELLKIEVDYSVGKDWIPKYVITKKTLGNQQTVETYMCENKANVIRYKFKDTEGEIHKAKISTPPRYSITSCVGSTCMIFLRSKKINLSGKNEYTVFSNFNRWSYEGPPKSINLQLEKIGNSSETIRVDGNDLTGDYYKIFAPEDENANRNSSKYVAPTFVKIFMSKHASIAYDIQGENKTKIKIKYLHDLES